uniref:Uncharacterized protein n=1 Tax=Marseillevirus LCMAC101 TaxID=2506602 RepID=A0A481YS06_9VIRU|nr:MAG: hypothetical protein LCMAC101_04140 [Marseillevirus LCMAC101]
MPSIYLIVFLPGEEKRFSIPMDKIPKTDIDLFSICDCERNHDLTKAHRVMEVLKKYTEYQLSIRITNTGIYVYENVPTTGNTYYTFIINFS